MIISITGKPGSGKSTIAKKIAAALGYQYYYMGKIRREAARAMNMTITEYNKYGETHPETDKQVDDYQKKLAQTKENFVIDGRMSWYFIPHSIKIFFEVDPRVGARRVYKELQKTHHRNEDKEMHSENEVRRSHQNRIKSDKYRYLKYYNIDYTDKKNFDLVLDTTNLTPKQVFNKTMGFINAKLDI